MPDMPIPGLDFVTPTQDEEDTRRPYSHHLGRVPALHGPAQGSSRGDAFRNVEPAAGGGTANRTASEHSQAHRDRYVTADQCRD